MASTIATTKSQINSLTFSRFLKTMGPKKRSGTMNHNLASRNLNEVIGLVLVIDVMKIQKR